MPCRYDPSPEELITPQVQKELDKLTRMLCEVMQLLAAEGLDSKLRLSAETFTWWQRHKKIDNDRRVRETALAKLTEEERRVLGLKE